MYLAMVSPAVTLADIAARRRLLNETGATLRATAGEGAAERREGLMIAVRALAAQYANHWAYKPEWTL